MMLRNEAVEPNAKSGCRGDGGRVAAQGVGPSAILGSVPVVDRFLVKTHMRVQR
ncbi:hypothetical protein HNP60_003691 [Sphingobium sp. B1D3A]|uniref:Uncharacterized protein n=1 Tax=Sphingobium lignivorans TaxID=2735886 RepID=A0ABR6NKA4_9SPHN|nr:hypothetical protein [Sphingobium lignivorans]